MREIFFSRLRRVDFFLFSLYNKTDMAHYRCEESYKTDFCDVDFKDELKISALLSRFESIASKSADELEFGYKYLKERGYAFFLAEISCVLSRAVPLYETLSLRTWPTPPSYVVFGREYEGYAESGAKILSATSRWCAVDFSTGKLLTPKAFPEQDYRNAEIYDPAKSGAPQTKTAKLSAGEGEKKFSIKIANSEYDHNMHVNNTHYADYCLNCFSVAELADKYVSSFSIAYVKQCKEGETLSFYRKDEADFSVIGGFNEEGENVVRAEFSFAKRGARQEKMQIGGETSGGNAQ